MQGKKKYHEKLFLSFRLSKRVPKSNFYRKLKKSLNLRFLYKVTEGYYAKSGNKSIDPVVFFKICLIGFLENINNDRKLIDFCSMRLDIIYFLGYNIDEKLPCYSTIRRTRKLFPKSVFDKVFNKILKMCEETGTSSEKNKVAEASAGKPMHLMTA